MKKRIISLILVVAMLLLTLTSCAYNYAKKDLTDYATLDAQALYNALHNLLIKDGDFGTDPAEREKQVNDTILQALLKASDGTKLVANKTVKDGDTVTSVKIGNGDSFYYCYFATDAEGHIFFADKMDASKPTNIQIGLSTVKDLEKLIADKIGTVDNIKDYIYYNPGSNVVGLGDVISVSYMASWTEGETEKSDVVWNEYLEVTTQNELASKLIGLPIGAQYPEQITATVKDGETDIVKTFTNVKVEHMVNDKSLLEVQDGDMIFITYTVEFDATPFYNEDTQTYDFGDDYNNIKHTTDGGKYKATITNDTLVADAYEFPPLQEGQTAEDQKIPDEAKTLENQIVGKVVGTSYNIDLPKATVNGKTVEINCTNVKANWIVKGNNAMTNDGGATIDVKYTPYTEALNADGTNKKTQTDIYGNAITLNEVELTYYIFPVYFVDVVDTENAEEAAKFILTEFGKTLGATESHDHTEESHEHKYVLEAFNKNYVDGSKTVATLADELVNLCTTLAEKEEALVNTSTGALTKLKTAQSDLAKATEATREEYQTKLNTAYETYKTAKGAEQVALANVSDKVVEILKCKEGENAIAKDIVDSYEEYTEHDLEATYEETIKTNLAKEIVTVLQNNVVFSGNLPKRAVKQARKAALNVHKNNYYTGSTSNQKNYDLYSSFDAYLIATLKVDNKEAAYKAIDEEAERTVKEIILIYVFLDAVEEAWNTDLTLTKQEKKTIKKNLESQALLYKQLYQQYGISFEYNVDDYYHAIQFDDIINFLLTEKEDDSDLKVKFENIEYKVSENS